MKTLKIAFTILLSAYVLFFLSCEKKKSDDNTGITLAITNPDNESQYTTLDIITFTGTASDEQDGDLTGNSLTWYSSIDGELDNGTQIIVSLSAGTHIITLTAVDSEQNKKSATITVIVNAPAIGDCAFNITGTWNFTNSNATHSGVCPPGSNSSGTCEITQAGNVLSLSFTSGWECDPVSMCSYDGICSGDIYTFGNSAVVDDEGGEVTNTIIVEASSASSLSGSSLSIYVLDDYVCTWGYDVVFTRAE